MRLDKWAPGKGLETTFLGSQSIETTNLPEYEMFSDDGLHCIVTPNISV